jgi:hypothetical protein
VEENISVKHEKDLNIGTPRKKLETRTKDKRCGTSA